MISMILAHLRAGWRGYAFAVAAVALVTLLVGVVLGRTDLANSSSLYLIAVLATAASYGRGPAVLASVLALVAFDFLFVEPTFAFTLPSTLFNPQAWITLLLFL